MIMITIAPAPTPPQSKKLKDEELSSGSKRCNIGGYFPFPEVASVQKFSRSQK